MRLTITLILCTLLLASCSFHANNWQSNSLPGSYHASFNSFNGKTRTESLQAQAGDLIFVQYIASVTSGVVTMELRHEGRSIWQKQLASQSDTASFHVTVPKTGEYMITIKGDRAAGSFDIRYSKASPRNVTVRTSRNIELFGLIMQLDNGQVLDNKDSAVLDGRRRTWQDWYAILVRNYPRYRKFDTCSAVRLFQSMNNDGYFYDFFVGFLLQVDEVPNARINASTDLQKIYAFDKKEDTAGARRKATAFLDALNAFYHTVDFDAYLKDNRLNYENANATVEKNLPKGYLLPVMEHYYRGRFNDYCLVPSLNILTSMGFGITNISTGTIFNTFGPFTSPHFDDEHPDMGFNRPDNIRELTVHEFGHPFSNPCVDRMPDALMDSSKYLYEPIKKQMAAQAYGSWRTCLFEHFVRAGEVVIARKLGDSVRAQAIMDDYVKNRSFIYLPFLVAQLERWDKVNPPDARFDDAVLTTMRKLIVAYKK